MVEAILVIPLAFLCWTAWKALQRETPALDLTPVLEALRGVVAAIQAIPQPEPVDLSPLAPQPFPEPQDLTPLIRAIIESKPILRPVDLAPLASALSTAQRESLQAYQQTIELLAPVMERILPQLHNMGVQMDDLAFRVATAATGRKVLSLP